jgi:hypothetical protein
MTGWKIAITTPGCDEAWVRPDRSSKGGLWITTKDRAGVFDIDEIDDAVAMLAVMCPTSRVDVLSTVESPT